MKLFVMSECVEVSFGEGEWRREWGGVGGRPYIAFSNLDFGRDSRQPALSGNVGLDSANCGRPWDLDLWKKF